MICLKIKEKNKEKTLLKDINKLTKTAFDKRENILGKINFSDYSEVKSAFKRKILTAKGAEKIKLNLLRQYISFDKKNINSFSPYREFDVKYLIVAKKMAEFQEHLASNSVNIRDEIGRPYLYIATLCGYRKFVIMLLKGGALPYLTNSIMKSSPLHAASYYGHYRITRLLLEVGADFSIQNDYQNTAYDEASSSEIKLLMKNFKTDVCYNLFLNFRVYMKSVKLMFNNNQYVGKRLQISDEPFSNSDKITWHGTKISSIESILKYGLRKIGEKLDGITVKKRDEYEEIRKHTRESRENESTGIFTSPSILYASHPCYAEPFTDYEKNQWVAILECRLTAKSYVKGGGTVKDYKLKNGEPKYLEYSVEDSKNIKVIAVWFLLNKYLKDHNDYNLLNQNLLNYTVDNYDDDIYYTDFSDRFKDTFDFFQRCDKVFFKNSSEIGSAFFGRRFLIKKVEKETWSWDLSWHGTKLQNTKSILKNGLLKPGQVTSTGIVIDVRKDTARIERYCSFQGKNDWAEAIFTSSSILYSATGAYAEEFINNKTKNTWILLFECRLKPGTYKKGKHTFNRYNFIKNEPEELEYRSEKKENVRITALWLIKKSFLEAQTDFKSLMDVLTNYMEA